MDAFSEGVSQSGVKLNGALFLQRPFLSSLGLRGSSLKGACSLARPSIASLRDAPPRHRRPCGRAPEGE